MMAKTCPLYIYEYMDVEIHTDRGKFIYNGPNALILIFIDALN